MKRLSPVLAVLVGVALTLGTALSDDDADRAAIREAGDQALRAAQAEDVTTWVSFFTDDATMHPPNEPSITGKDAIHAWLEEKVANPNFAIDWKTTKVDVSGGGDMGFATGTYEVTVSDEEGKPVAEKGKWVSVYKKQADGSWKCVADIWNLNPPPA